MSNPHFIAPGPSGSSAADDAGSITGGRPSSARQTPGHAPGDVFAGRYRLVGLLGEGGMGTVWRAHSLSLDTDVAIKVLHREQADSQAADRLLREARALASLGHPAIVRAFDFGETHAGEPYLVMELLEGISLAAWLDTQGRMPAAQAVQMLLPIAGALAAAHAQGVVHRDIKPENIIAVPDGLGSYQPKIVDFGIAKLLVGKNGQVLTQTGMVLGSLEYMSPEQADGRPEVGEQTDIWGLSVVLYELITGRRPFEAPTVTSMMFALYTCAPTPTTHYAAGDDELWAIIEQGLQKSPAARWPTMRAFGHALASWAAERGITSDAAGTSLHHQWLSRSSRPSIIPAGESAISTATTRIARSEPPAGAPLASPLARSEPPPPRTSTTENACSSSDVLRRVSLLRRPRPRLLGAAIALLVVPVIVVGALLAHQHGRASAGSPLGAPTAAVTEPAPVAAVAVPPPPVEAPVAAATEKPTAENAPPALETRDPRAAPTARRRRVSTPMPLPATPNF